jgi:hypothetical protein
LVGNHRAQKHGFRTIRRGLQHRSVAGLPQGSERREWHIADIKWRLSGHREKIFHARLFKPSVDHRPKRWRARSTCIE